MPSLVESMLSNDGDSLPLDSVQNLSITCNVAVVGRNSLQDSGPGGWTMWHIVQ